MKKEYILSIHVGHDSSVAIVQNSKIIAAAAEERFTKLKHYNQLPLRALEFCLKEAGISINDISLLVIPTVAAIQDIGILLGIKNKATVRFREDPEKKKNLKDLFRYFLLNVSRIFSLWTPLEPPSYVKTYKLPKDSEVLHIEHHLAHAASAYYTSGFNDKTLVVTADGSGDGLSTTVWVGKKGKLTPRLKIGREGSLGAFYGLITEALGWWVGDGEGKTMGLAPYGNTRKTKGVLDEFLPVYENGRLKKGFNWGFPGMWVDLSGAHWHYKDTSKVLELIKKYGRENIAAEAQRVLEDQLVNLIAWWVKEERVKSLAVAGGVFLNVKANQKIWETGLFKNFHIYPDAGDAGITVGAALYGYYKDQPNEKISKITNLYYGPSYSNEEIENILKVRQIPYTKLDRKSLLEKTARLLADNKIIGWFQGRMEIGPRALGNRSILMDPRRAENKDIINSRVKYREPFRPFCPSAIDKAEKIYFKNIIPNASFMVVSSDTREKKRREIPAVVHVDNTVRPQILKRLENPLFYDLISEFDKITGVPILLNTSFNIRGDPIVLSPQDAIKTFYDTGMDYLVLGNYFISK